MAPSMSIGLSLSRMGASSSGVNPFATAFIPTEGTHYPTGAQIDIFHPTTATITSATRADGLASFSAMADVTGTKTLTPGSGTNQGPILRDIPVYDQTSQSVQVGTVKAMEFTGTEIASLKDTVQTAGNKFALFIVGKMHTMVTTTQSIFSRGYPLADGGVAGTSFMNTGLGGEVFAAHYAGDTGAVGTAAGRGRTFRVGGSIYLTDSTIGVDAASCDKGLIQVPESTCVHWIVSRSTNDATYSDAVRRYRAGINGNAVNGPSATSLNTTSVQGWTIGSGITTAGAISNAGSFTVYALYVVRWTGTEMTLAQGNAMASALQTAYDVRSHNARLVYCGDSRANEGGITGTATRFRTMKSATWPDGGADALPSNIQTMQFGAGGTTLQKLLDWLPGGAAQHVLLTNWPFPVASGKTTWVPEWYHNDMGTAGDTLYTPTTASTNGRADAIVTLFATTCGTLADSVTQVLALVPNASSIGTTLLDRGRDTSPNAVRSAAFVTTAKGATPARNVSYCDIAALTFAPIPTADKTTFVSTGTDTSGMQVFNTAVGSNDLRNPATSGTDVYYMAGGAGRIFQSDLTHPDAGGSIIKGRLIARAVRSLLV